MKYNSFYLLGLQFLLLFHSYISSKVIALTSSQIAPNPGHPLKTFNVVKKFGAKKDGKTDATRAFHRAWKAACASSAPSEIYVPHGTYLLRPITFEGNNCKLDFSFRIDGTLIAHNVTYRDENWLVFHNVNGLYIKGGVLDAKGKILWDCKEGRSRSHNLRCPAGAKSLSFESSKNIIVDGLTSRNSQMFHITINAGQNIHMRGVTITADADSPNTDGIHIEKSKGITIIHSEIMTGDDCISIGPNNRDIWVENIFCGPGHGISIGSLGRLSDEGVVVKNVTVKSVTFLGTYNGLRIKTFSTPIYGIVKDIYFLGATMVDVRYPIIIDQNYCPHGTCPRAQGSGIQISNVIYKRIHGTSSSPEIVTFNCSSKKPCYRLMLQDIDLSYSQSKPKCHHRNAYWKILGYMQPSNCLGTFYDKLLQDGNSYL